MQRLGRLPWGAAPLALTGGWTEKTFLSLVLALTLLLQLAGLSYGTAGAASSKGRLPEAGGEMEPIRNLSGTAWAQFTAADRQYLSHEDNPYLSTGESSWSLSVWVWLDTKTASGPIIAKSNGLDQHEYALWYLMPMDRFAIEFPGVTLQANSYGPAAVGAWHHVVATYKGRNLAEGTDERRADGPLQRWRRSLVLRADQRTQGRPQGILESGRDERSAVRLPHLRIPPGGLQHGYPG